MKALKKQLHTFDRYYGRSCFLTDTKIFIDKYHNISIKFNNQKMFWYIKIVF